MKKSQIILVIILVLLLGNIFFATKYLAVQNELRQTQAVLKIQKTNEKVLNFTKLFIEKVLKSKSEVNFETRLKLENAVRGLDDNKILNQWNEFTNSKTENEAQKQVKNLLEMLVDKISVQ